MEWIILELQQGNDGGFSGKRVEESEQLPLSGQKKNSPLTGAM